jgi:hypothetical protein
VLRSSSRSTAVYIVNLTVLPEEILLDEQKLFLKALDAHKIRLLDLVENYQINGENLDPADSPIHFWIEGTCETSI